MKNNYLKSSNLFKASLALLAFCSTQVQAQLVNCNIFLQGNYLEIGIGPNGAFGSSEQAPAGYHPNVTDTMYSCVSSLVLYPELGFVADPNKDGWTVGYPAYYGDYILPGSVPHEGWAMSDSTGTATAYSSYYYSGTAGYTGALSGSNTLYNIAGTTKNATWEGIFGGDSISVSQTTTIDTTNLYLNMHISFANTHDTATDTFYYLRSINAHNEATITSNLSTKNKIEYQLPNTGNMTVVSASGITYPDAYMELGTVDTRARGFLIKDSTLPLLGSLAGIYAGDSANYQYSDSITGNLGIGLIFKIVLAAGAGTTLDFGYSFKAGVMDSVLGVGDSTGTGTGTGTLQTKNLYATENISVYPNPTNGMINVTGLKSGEYIEMYDMLGRSTGEIIAYNGQQVCSFSISNIPSGIYLMDVKYNDGKTVSITKITKE
jgi:hypothetical protein